MNHPLRSNLTLFFYLPFFLSTSFNEGSVSYLFFLANFSN